MKPKAWSYSALNNYLNCPRSYYEISVVKNFKDVMGAEALKGDKIHKNIEAYIKRGGKLQPSDLMPKEMVEHVLRVLAELPEGGKFFAESKYALNKNLEQCGWFDKDTWQRSILDVLYIKDQVAYIIDWKTGKVRPDIMQLKLFALVMFTINPKIQTCHTSFEWIAYGESTPESFDRSQMLDLWNVFTPKLKLFTQSFKTNTWPAKPSGLCKRHCIVTTCSHNGNYKGS